MPRQGRNGNPATCVACHGNAPHKKEPRLNQHTAKVACQTCHIPAFARGGIATKMTWDWSTAGELDADGKQIVRKDEKGRIIYESRKGTFTLGENVKPEYFWFNGDVNYTLVTDKIEKTDRRTPINRLGGSPDRRQIDDLADQGVPRLAALRPGQQDAGHAAHRGQRRHRVTGKTWPGTRRLPRRHEGRRRALLRQVDFIKTEMSWPITHMVAPKEKALACVECHSKNGRLAGIEGVYMPGRDANRAGRHRRLGTGPADPARRHRPRPAARRQSPAWPNGRIVMTQRVYIFKGFERFWHWSQAGLIMFMMLTGFEIHGTYTLFGFEQGGGYHTIAAWTLVGLWVFAIFWHLTTGEWRHYIPTLENISVIAKYYSSGIFKHEPHPFKPSRRNKHNPLQRLTYLAILTLLSPLIWVTGWLYLFYADWPAWGLSQSAAGMDCHRPYRRRVPDAGFPHFAPLSRDHRPQGLLAGQGHDHRLGRSRVIHAIPANNLSSQESIMKSAKPSPPPPYSHCSAFRSRPRPTMPTGSAAASTTAAYAPPATWRCLIGSINPSTKTMAEWASYMKADKHAKGKDTVKQYVSKTYRAKIKSANKAAEKFADVPDQELFDDLAAFLTKGAKDGEAPASCS